jgi:hypothetical protein
LYVSQYSGATALDELGGLQSSIKGLRERHARAAIKSSLAARHEGPRVKASIDSFFCPTSHSVCKGESSSFAAYREGIFAESGAFGLWDHERGDMHACIFK